MRYDPYFTEEGVSIPVTVIEIEPNRVTQFKTESPMAIVQCKSLQVSVVLRVSSKAQAGHFAKANVAAGRGVGNSVLKKASAQWRRSTLKSSRLDRWSMTGQVKG